MLNVQSQKNNSTSFGSNFVKNPFFKQVVNRAIKTSDEKALNNLRRVLNDGKKDEYKLEKYFEESQDTFGCRLKKNNREITSVCLDPSYYGKNSTVESALHSLDHIQTKPLRRAKSEISKELKVLKEQIFNTRENLTHSLDEIS